MRNDTGVSEGAEISLYYDPMISKLCTHGPTREAAIDAMADALDGISGRFDSFGDFAKGFLSDLNRQLLQFALKDLGITGEGGIIEGTFAAADD